MATNIFAEQCNLGRLHKIFKELQRRELRMSRTNTQFVYVMLTTRQNRRTLS